MLDNFNEVLHDLEEIRKQLENCGCPYCIKYKTSLETAIEYIEPLPKEVLVDYSKDVDVITGNGNNR